jgi:hypothetical protein
MDDAQIKELNFTCVMKTKDQKWGFKPHPETLLQYLCFPLTAVTTVCSGKYMELMLWLEWPVLGLQ